MVVPSWAYDLLLPYCVHFPIYNTTTRPFLLLHPQFPYTNGYNRNRYLCDGTVRNVVTCIHLKISILFVTFLFWGQKTESYSSPCGFISPMARLVVQKYYIDIFGVDHLPDKEGKPLVHNYATEVSVVPSSWYFPRRPCT